MVAFARVPRTASLLATFTGLLAGVVRAQTNCNGVTCTGGQALIGNAAAVQCANEAGGTCTSVTCCAYTCSTYNCGSGFTNLGSSVLCPSAYYGGCNRDYCCTDNAATTGGTTGGTTGDTTGDTTGGTTGGTAGDTASDTTGGTTGGTTDGTAATAAGTCADHTCSTQGKTLVGNPSAVQCSINTNGGICDDNLCCTFACSSLTCANGGTNLEVAPCRSEFFGGCAQDSCCSTTTGTSTSATTAAPTPAPTAATTTTALAPATTTGGSGNAIAPVNGGANDVDGAAFGGADSMPGNTAVALQFGEALTGLWKVATQSVTLMSTAGAGAAAAGSAVALVALVAVGLLIHRRGASAALEVPDAESLFATDNEQ